MANLDLKLVSSNEITGARYFSTTVEREYQINPVLSVKLDLYVALSRMSCTNLYAVETQDWRATYYIGGEQCKTDGVKELFNKLFVDLSYDKISEAIKEIAEDDASVAKDLPDFKTIYSLTQSQAADVLEQLISKSKPTVNPGVTFIHNWDIKTVAELANDPRLKEIPVHTDYDLQRIARGNQVQKSVRKVLVLSED